MSRESQPASDDWVILPQPQQPSPTLLTRQRIAPRYGLPLQWDPVDREETASKATYIIAGLLIPGKGEPVADQAVISVDGKIEYVGSQTGIPAKYDDLEPVHVPFLLPGLWECHGHFIAGSPDIPMSIENTLMQPAAEAGARAARLAYDTLYAGYTSLVELGGYGTEAKKVIDEGSILGPTIYPAGAAITMTAGHGDAFALPIGCVWHAIKPGYPGSEFSPPPFIMADGVDECRKAVRLNLRRGAQIIKVFTSGGVVSRDDDPKYQQFSDEELSAIASEASRMGLVCTAHAISKPGIQAAIRAGFKVIQHAASADDEVVAEMKAKDIIAVFTAWPIQALSDNKDKYPKHITEKLERIIEEHRASYTRSIKAGVKIALGSDLFDSPGSPLAPGLNGQEIICAVKAGMTPLQAIEAATATGPLTLGSRAPKSGQIRTGYDADFIALEHNPLENIKLFGEPKNIKWIWKAGQLVKAPGLNPWDVLRG